MGQPGTVYTVSTMDESIVYGGEAKPKVARSSGFGQASRERTDSGTVWEGRRDRVRAPYTKSVLSSLDPEYHGAREIPWEYGGTTLQA